nr:protein ABHD17B-like [Ipomoea batatas]
MFAFFPPSHSVVHGGRDESCAGKFSNTGGSREGILWTFCEAADSKGNEIVAVHVKASEGVSYYASTLTVMPPNLGQMFELFVELSLRLRINLMVLSAVAPTIDLGITCAEFERVCFAQSNLIWAYECFTLLKGHIGLTFTRISTKSVWWLSLFSFIHGTAEMKLFVAPMKAALGALQGKNDPLWINGGGHCNLELYTE